jgi:hypothetical protein
MIMAKFAPLSIPLDQISSSGYSDKIRVNYDLLHVILEGGNPKHHRDPGGPVDKKE